MLAVFFKKNAIHDPDNLRKSWRFRKDVFLQKTASAEVYDQTIKIGNNSYQLSTLRSVQTKSEQWRIGFADGSKGVLDKPAQFPTLHVHIVGEPWRMNLKDASEIRIEPLQPPLKVEQTIVVRQRGTEAILGKAIHVKVKAPIVTKSKSLK